MAVSLTKSMDAVLTKNAVRTIVCSLAYSERALANLRLVHSTKSTAWVRITYTIGR